MHSVGTFYSALAWLALTNTPDLDNPAADGRPMLDNVLYSMRIMRVDPRHPDHIPDGALLEQWFQEWMQRKQSPRG
jgi:hypothetical protein